MIAYHEVVREFPWVEMAIALAALAYIVERVMDARGWSRSSRLLRQENEDLVRRNSEQESEVRELRAEVSKLEAQLEILRAQVRDLEKRDQAAVLEQLELHEKNAERRWENMVAVLTDIRDLMAQEEAV